MSRINNYLIVRQADKNLQRLAPLKDINQPVGGWVNLIRTTLGMSLKQLGNKLSITAPSVKEIEIREREGRLTLKSLREVAQALDMNLVYAFIPKDGSLEKLIERKAYEVAEKIVQRTSATMKLEAQGNSDERIADAIKELAEELKREMPKMLWD